MHVSSFLFERNVGLACLFELKNKVGAHFLHTPVKIKTIYVCNFISFLLLVQFII